MKNWYKPLKKFLLAVIIVLVAMIIYLCGIVFTEQNYEWFLALNKPTFQPASWVFMLVWAILFIFIAASAIIVLFGPKKSLKKCEFTIILFVFNAIFNAIFNLVFFGFHSIVGALIILPFFLASVFLLIWCVYNTNKIAAYLLVPYALWAIYATILMVNVFFIN
ncbi:TspO/MBR family protein [Patescibacteria group bacterium]